MIKLSGKMGKFIVVACWTFTNGHCWRSSIR